MSRTLGMKLSQSSPARARVSGGNLLDAPDGVLLGRFLAGRDNAAFEALVRRHGPRVLRVCRGRVGDGPAADDAFQATFMILLGRAGEIRRTDDVGPWLVGVARRVAARAKARADRLRTREGAALNIDEVPGRSVAGRDEIGPDLRAEVDRLPDRYRRPIELCYWEGLTSEQAAERLSCPTGTLKWRLSRGREILRGRLDRLGLGLIALLAVRLPKAEASGAVPDDLARRTSNLAAYLRDSHLGFPAAPTLAGRVRARRRIGLILLILVASSAPAWRPAARVLAAVLSPAPHPGPGESCH